jgi:hypothetical protein
LTAALANGVIIALAIVGLVAFLALLALVRVIMRRDITWHRFRAGVFFERDQDNDSPSP